MPTGDPRLMMKQPTPHPSKLEDDLDSENDIGGWNSKVKNCA